TQEVQAFWKAREVKIESGACEFKTSRTKVALEPYFIPQMYMEMISLNVVWCDLIRYRPTSVHTPDNGYVTQHTAHVYRIYRNQALEADLVRLWKRAHANVQQLQDIVQEP